ncbi:WG repeat-containing protein [Niabella ginsengisoli]|uniref:WG repeat-containing protein n=1 Tax=Niabella ginsengisoli TaxID=522298 RepID=A0ABS9SG63_9BACT|nr:WG repeat-containing protein [Niabella ginsengisoli]MCH5597348.1 WG repeat-containing protein [Niabella ginsengisoli]
MAHYYDNANFVIVKSNNLLGALDKNNALIVPQEFSNIMPLDANGKHYLFLTTNKEYFIADSLGKNILPKNFVYTKQEPTVDFVKDNTILGSFDGSNFGIYNFIDKTEIVPFEFEEAGFVKNEYYRVKKNGVYGLYGSKEHKMLLPFEQGATYVNTVFNTNDKLFIVFEKEIGGKGKTNIYEDGKLLFEERYAVKSIDYGFDFPFITGRIDDDTHFVYDCNARRMIMYGLPYIQNFNEIYYLDEQKEHIVIPAIIDPEKVNGRKIPYIMLANTKGEIVAGFQAQQKFRRVDLSGSSKPIFLCAHNNNVGESFTDIRFNSQEIIASVPTNTSDVNNVKIVDNRIVLLLEAGRPFEIKAKGTVSGGKILIDADGNIDYSTP